MSDGNVRVDHGIGSRDVDETPWIVSLGNLVHLELSCFSLGIGIFDALFYVSVKDSFSLRHWIVLPRHMHNLRHIFAIQILHLQ